jgi:hypothetical protein
MIDDIIKSFEESFTGGNGNPFQNIMQINELITNKYQDKIENGEIDLNQIMGSLQKTMPNLGDIGGLGSMLSTMTGTEEPKEKVLMDENFSTASVQLGELPDDKPNMIVGNVLKTVSSLGGMGMGGSTEEGSGGPDLSKIMGIFSKLGSEETKPEDLQTIFQNDLGIDMDKLTEQMSKALGKND